MLTNKELKKLLGDIEADNVERTISTSKTDKFCKAICAFSNDMPGHAKPGYLIIGADDKTGAIKGINITDQLLQTLAGYRNDGQIMPRPSLVVQKHSFPEGDLALVEVQPSDMPPTRYQGRVWIRVGPSQGIASEEEERRLTERRVHSAKTFDLQACLGCGQDQIVRSLFHDYLAASVAPEIIAENNRDLFLQMAALRLWDMKKQCLTNAGTLLISEAPQDYFPGAYVQFVRFEGEALESNVLDERQFSGDLRTMLHELDVFLGSLFPSRPVQVSVLKEEQIRPYPKGAVRELLMNAVMHRDYESNAPIRFYWFSDRIEIQNAGGLYGAASNFPKQNDYRNPQIAESMKNLGYVNRFGRGIAATQSLLQKNGNQPALFDISQPTFFLAKILEVCA